MMNNSPNLDLVEFVETKILPQYAAFDRGHNLSHVTQVIRRSLTLARQMGCDLNMAYVVAAYHDLGLSGPRAVHHLESGRILAADARLKRWFSPAQIGIMKEAVEDHRASASRAPRSIYGKVVAEADRDLRQEVVFSRAITYGLDHYPQLNYEQQWERFRQHMERKYSRHGYIHLWIAGSENEKMLQQLREIIADEARLRDAFEEIMKAVNSSDKTTQ